VLESLDTQAIVAGEQARRVGDKMLAALNEAFDLNGQDHHITPSIGITLFSPGQTQLDELMKQADLAMYAAKASGRNALRFFDPTMQASVLQRADLEQELREALRQGQMVLFYQAQVDESGSVLGAEALLRWRHPSRGLVGPADFIPMAEQTGLIVTLGQWVLEQACAQLARWQALPEMAALTLSVNVSARQFRQPDFVAGVLAAVRRHDVQATRLKLELTESVLLHDVDDVIAKMAELQAFGVGFALDDFGTGYSSLAYIKRLPIEQLKIDKSFVRDLLTDSNDAAIAQAIIALAQKLQISVMAEGVETAEQRNWLIQHGCLMFQGYLFAKPVPADAFSAAATPA
jgi:EAL domain-containing protein (putative c-di-GMP-specific phosphodiesterase class I)